MKLIEDGGNDEHYGEDDADDEHDDEHYGEDGDGDGDDDLFLFAGHHCLGHSSFSAFYIVCSLCTCLI